MIIDIHAHIFPDNLAENAIASLSKRSKIQPQTNGTLAYTLSYFKNLKIDKFVAQNIAVNPKTQTKVNDFAISVNGGNCISFGSVHPFADDAVLQVQRLAKNNIKGVKFHCEYQNFLPCDKQALEVIYECIKNNLVIMFHGGVDIGYNPPYKSTPENFSKMYKALPYDKYIVAHMGGYLMHELAIKYLAPTQINIDTSFAITKMDVQTAHTVIDAFGVDRVLFGSDCPWDSPSDTIEAINKLKYNSIQKQKILGANAARLLNL